MDGLDIDEAQFMKLKPAERDLLIYKNLRGFCDMDHKSKFHLKIQYVWLSILTLVTASVLGFKSFISS